MATVSRFPRRRKRHRDNTDFAAMIRRMIAAHGRRVAFGDEADLAELIELHRAVDDAVSHAVVELHDRQGFPWSTIAQATGITRQSAWERWGKRRASDGTD